RVDKNQSSLASQQTTPRIISPTVTPTSTTTRESSQRLADVAINDQADPAINETTNEQKVPTTTNEPVPARRTNVNFNGGFFKSLYDQQATAQTPGQHAAIAGVFKSTSGWQDGKYYCFIDGAAPGTAVRITDIVSGKSVYAKVLDAIPEIKQNEGFNIILSNAAAEELGAIENKFNCTISYASL